MLITYPFAKRVEVKEDKTVSDEDVLYEAKDGVATITINRPDKYNALNTSVVTKLRELFGQAEDDPNVRVVVLTGAGEKAFAAGADISEFKGKDSKTIRPRVERGQELTKFIESMSKPSIAAVNGFALGGGCEFAMACDIRYASANAKLGQPEINLGVIPGYGGTQRFPRLVGVKNAWEILRTGNPISSEVAARIGYIMKEVEGNVVDAALDLLKDVLAGARTLTPIKKDPIEVPDDLPEVEIGHLSKKIDGLLCEAVLQGAKTTLEEGLKIEAKAFGACLRQKTAGSGWRTS